MISNPLVVSLELLMAQYKHMGLANLKCWIHNGYSSDTFIGMSGGGVFSSDGKLIAIHGRGSDRSSNVNKTGTNFGIGINEILFTIGVTL